MFADIEKTLGSDHRAEVIRALLENNTAIIDKELQSK